MAKRVRIPLLLDVLVVDDAADSENTVRVQ